MSEYSPTPVVKLIVAIKDALGLMDAGDNINARQVLADALLKWITEAQKANQ